MEVPLENLASFLQMPLEVASVATKVPENMVMRSLELIVDLGNYYLECWFELVLLEITLCSLSFVDFASVVVLWLLFWLVVL